jgi:hypothetical protein
LEKEHNMRRFLPLVFIGALAAPAAVSAQGFAIAGQAGSMGVGGSVIIGVAPKVNIRGTFGYIPFDTDLDVDDISFTLDIPTFFRATLDLYPMSFFHVSAGGLFLTKSGDIGVAGTFNGSLEFGGTTYSGAEVGTLSGNFNLKNAMPYLGIGFGNPVGRTIGINLDFGVGFGNTPTVENVTASGAVTNLPGWNSDLAAKVADIEADIPEILKYYPVVTLSLSIGIGG